MRFDPRRRYESGLHTISRLIDRRMKAPIVVVNGASSSFSSAYDPDDDDADSLVTADAPLIADNNNLYIDTTGANTGDVLTYDGAAWGAAPPSAGSAHDILSVTHGDTVAAAVVRGDLIVGNATPAWERLAKGTSGRFLQAGATDVAWSAWGLPATAPNAGNFLRDDGTWAAVSAPAHDVLSTTHGDTLADTVVRGDLIIGNATPKWSRLAKGASGRFLQAGASDIAWSAWVLPAAAGSAGEFLAYNGTWAVPAGTNYWQRVGTTLSPATAGDIAKANTLTAEIQFGLKGLAVGNVPASGYGYIWADGATGDLKWTQDILGTGAVTTDILLGTHRSLDDHTMYAKLTGRSTGQTLQGGTGASEVLHLESTAHATKAYVNIKAGSFLRVEDKYIQMTEQGSAPTGPGAGNLSVYGRTAPVGTESQLCMVGDTGLVHDLTCQGKECFPVVQSEDEPNIFALPNTFGKRPGAFAAPTSITKTSIYSWTTPGSVTTPASLKDSYAELKWLAATMIPGPGTVTQAYVVIATPVILWPGDAGSVRCKTVRAHVRIRLVDRTLFDHVILAVSDSTDANRSSNDLYASIAVSNTWYSLYTDFYNVGGWSDSALRVSLTVFGRGNPAPNPGEMPTVHVETLGIEFWAQ